MVGARLTILTLGGPHTLTPRNHPRGSQKTGVQTPSNRQRQNRHQCWPTMYFLVIALSRTQETLVCIVRVVLGLALTQKHFRHTIAGLLALATSLFARGKFWDFLGYTQVEHWRSSARAVEPGSLENRCGLWRRG